MNNKVITKVVSGVLISQLLLANTSYSFAETNEKATGNITIGMQNDGYSVEIPILYQDSFVSVSSEDVCKMDVARTLKENPDIQFDEPRECFVVGKAGQRIQLFFSEPLQNRMAVTVAGGKDSQRSLIYEVVPPQESLQERGDEEIVNDKTTEESSSSSSVDATTSTEENTTEIDQQTTTSSVTFPCETAAGSIASSEKNQTDLSDSESHVKQPRKLKSVSDLVVEDKQLGWSDQRDALALKEVALESGTKVQYGFATERDLIETLIRMKTTDGKIVDYRNNSSTGKYKAIRLYTRESKILKDNYSLIPAIKLQQITEKDGAIRGYGEFDLSASAVYSYHFLVRLTLVPDFEKQCITTTYELIRVDQPIADMKPFDQDFYQLTNMELAGKSTDQVFGIGGSQGVMLQNGSYQANLAVKHADGPDAWDVGDGTKWDFSIGIHWPIRPVGAGDFFSTGKDGLAQRQFFPGQQIGKFDSPTVAMRWNKQAMSSGDSRVMSYDVMIDEPVKPELTVDAYDNIIQQNTKDAIDLKGAVKGASQVYYQLDDGEIQTMDVKEPNWSLSLPIKKITHGKHLIRLVAQNKNGVSSEEIESAFRVVNDKDKWVVDTEVTAVTGDINHLHIGDELSYVVTLNCIAPDHIPVEGSWNYVFSKYFDVVEQQAIFTDRGGHNKQTFPVVNQQVTVPEFSAGPKDKLTLTFRVKLKENTYNKKPTELINESMVKDIQSGKEIVHDIYALTGTQKVSHFPILKSQTRLETASEQNELRENEEFTLKTSIKNDAVDYSLKNDTTGNIQQFFYTVSKVAGLSYSEVKIYKNGKEVPASIASGSVQTEEDRRETGDNALVRFQADIKPQEEYEIQVKGKLEDPDLVASGDPIHLSMTGKSGGNESVESSEMVALPKIIPTGDVWIEQVNDELELGAVRKMETNQKVYADSLSVDIEDTREKEQDWSLMIYSQIGLKADPSKTLELFYQENGSESPQALSDGIEIKGNGKEHLDLAESIYAEIYPETSIGNYQGILTWELKDAP